MTYENRGRSKLRTPSISREYTRNFNLSFKREKIYRALIIVMTSYVWISLTHFDNSKGNLFIIIFPSTRSSSGPISTQYQGFYKLQ